ncbi:uncharacterized protein J4E84_001798 [Alternaria hordeiaustralica]|uniref:uncharacterized protein n=1 Tax=Alternaria viburni TaxID=566460 RepID=UPI0020C47BFE|nr:uncharacterized protein J4E79_002589 [Alternaria viburni]XP_049247784.1 uncharacterized protein J4E84_001798 [Alternaria hordeiaustralica]KAI4666550.1 hypothetical protein J4E79_002589 [Alternaria viburni]KAI4695173.1 hypothetical protein J4E84_001798 [Alternaria hordeiaustralica]
MGSKRKHQAEKDCAPSQKPRKRSRRGVQETRAVSQNEGNHDRGVRHCRGEDMRLPHPKRGHKKPTNIVAELANLADYNAPPVKRSRKDTVAQLTDDEMPRARSSRNRVRDLRTSGSTAQSAHLGEKLRVQGARITKSTTTGAHRRKTSLEEKVRAEADRLGRWLGWVSEEEKDDESDDEDEYVPRSHSRRYPPKKPGTQNAPWSDLPGEVRNLIYQYAMTDEEKKILNVRHYPEGVPRRSVRGIACPTNFAHSYWGFTQICRQIRNEFTPWLLEKRRVRTALETINDYVNIFHRPDKDGEVVGWVEPICCGAPLPQHGVDILSLLKLREPSSRFHLQLTPTTISEALDALIMPTDPDDFDELKIMRDMARTFRTWSQDNVISLIGLDGINITSVPKGLNTITSTTEDEDDAQHEILIKFIMRPGQTEKAPDKYRLHCLNKIIFASELSKKTGVKLKACFDTGVAKWKVRRIGVVDTCWTARAGGSKISRRLMKYCYSPGYKGESLD